MGLAWTSLPEFGTIIAMRRIQLVLASTLITLAAAAMPTKDELSKAQSVANDQMKDHIAANKNGKESNEAVGDAASDVEYRFNYILDNKGDAILCKTCNDPYGKDGEACVSPKPVGELIIPEYIDGHKVVSIGRDAFDGCDKLTRMVLPKSIERFAYGGTFCARCYALREITVSPENPHFSTFSGALFTKDRKGLVVWPKARGEIRIPPETCEIESWSFIYYNLKALKLPKGITYVKGYSFTYCPNLEVVEFPEGLKRVDRGVFNGSPRVRKVIFNGDAPDADSFFQWAPANMVVEVRKGSKGWNGPGSTDLPERWPHDGGVRDTRDPSATSSSLCAKGIRHEHDKKTVRCRGGMCRAGVPQQNPERRIRNERDHASAASIRR
jgi:hypothetical protein